MVDPYANPEHLSYKVIKEYLDIVFGHDLVDLYRKVTQVTGKVNGALELTKFKVGCGTETQKTYKFDEELKNIEYLNRRLQGAIETYLMDYPECDCRFLIQFDGLDDNYAVLKLEQYNNAMISLFKCIYSINNIMCFCHEI